MQVFIYRGLRTEDGCTVIAEAYTRGSGLAWPYVGSEPLPQRQDIRNHSPDGFNWGYGGSGPAQLALALIAHATGSDHVPPRLYQAFKFAVVGRWDTHQWAISQVEILQWLYREQSHDQEADRPAAEPDVIDTSKGPQDGYTGGEL